MEVAERTGTNVGACSYRAALRLLGFPIGRGAQWPAISGQPSVQKRLEHLKHSLSDSDRITV
ncbi:hypothetical protein CC86DRAFT_57498 [Ophiobolus disseminans]|uniref:Uncharacterized protein n=1 Tax=Ophiobolus disseminans TaxID=1469910 RepID=A0A6A6ZS16_9PLEO|nr:hypothetical protein CC86DRAFT_57498 [Ophiobolus disseminans]